MSYSTLYLLLIVLFSCNCSSMSEPQEKEKSGAAGNQQSCLITGLYPVLAELNSTLQSLKASKDQEQFRRKEEHNVAFSASLGNRGDFGPFSTDVTLVYQNVFLNAGSHYNTGTGIFTAPVKGVYFFSLSGHNKTSRPMGLRLFKNGEPLIILYNHPLTDAGIRYETLSNSITLMLEKGDQVFVHLLANTWVFDNTDNVSLFTGHLVFPL